MLTPNGIDEIIATFGDVHQYVTSTGELSPSWNSLYLSTAILPFPIPLSWNRAVSITRITCHRLLVETLESVFNEIVSAGLQNLVTSYGGCFAFRPQRGASKLSAHVWGIAIDLNPEDNQQGTVGTMNAGIVEAFESAGFHWGGKFSGARRDDMHFQFCTNY